MNEKYNKYLLKVAKVNVPSSYCRFCVSPVENEQTYTSLKDNSEIIHLYESVTKLKVNKYIYLYFNTKK